MKYCSGQDFGRFQAEVTALVTEFEHAVTVLVVRVCDRGARDGGPFADLLVTMRDPDARPCSVRFETSGYRVVADVADVVDAG